MRILPDIIADVRAGREVSVSELRRALLVMAALAGIEKANKEKVTE